MRDASGLRAGFGMFVVLIATAGIAPGGASALSTATKCRATIVTQAMLYATNVTKVLASCRDATAAGKACDPGKTQTLVDKARIKLRSSIAKACGGKDKVCGGGFDPDVPLAAIGWNIGTCAGLGDGTCTHAIDDCGDIADCLTCVGDRAVDASLPLLYPAGTFLADKSVRKCARAVGKSGAGVLAKLAKRFGSCWLDVNKADSGGSFSCPSTKTLRALAKLKAAHVSDVCAKCGGANNLCGGGDDVAPTAIGFPATCPGTGACTGPINAMSDVVGCTDCILGGLADRTSRAWFPAFATSPPAPTCVPGPSATPVPTATP